MDKGGNWEEWEG